jgi:enterochelin esterase-like enzyme
LLSVDILPQPLQFRVYLPPCYREQPDRRYPVLYLIHGQSFNDDQWDRLGADEIADQLIASGDRPPFLIVMPRDRVWKPPEEDMFGQAVVNHLISFVEQRYRALDGRENRSIGGLSRGASWAVHLGFFNWELFSAVGAHSLPVFWSDGYKLSGLLDSIPVESMPRIFMDIGDKDQEAILKSARWFADLLNQKNIPHEWYLFTGYHEEEYWSSHIELYMRWYTQEW